MTSTNLISLQAKIDFLSRCESYPESPRQIESVETHMAWVFLAGHHAYKLKKPVRTGFLDFTTLAARRRDCHQEVHLNRRLAQNVYLAVVPITIQPDGNLQLDGSGEPVEWLVKMRRLPRALMLDQAIRDGTVSTASVESVGHLLATFYRRAAPAELSGSHYAYTLDLHIREGTQALMRESYGLSRDRIVSIGSTLARFVELNSSRLTQRVRNGRVIEAHGDLRPEHICMESPPVVIDCLEFSRELRILDTASEMSFLTLECDQLGAREVSDLLWRTYLKFTRDAFDYPLICFYRAFHAFARARLSIAHLADQSVRNPQKWKPRAEQYLQQALEAISDSVDRPPNLHNGCS